MSVEIALTAGLPLARKYTVTLPSGRSWWTEVNQIDVRMQIRKEPKIASRLIFDASNYLSLVKTSANIFEITLFIPGQDTSNIDQSGYYDVVMSDVGFENSRAYVISDGFVRVGSVVSLGWTE